MEEGEVTSSALLFCDRSSRPRVRFLHCRRSLHPVLAFTAWQFSQPALDPSTP